MHASNGKSVANVPFQWEHDTTLKNNHGWTVAMIAANFGHITTLPK